MSAAASRRSALARHWPCNRVRRVARHAGRLDAAGKLGALSVALVGRAKARALEAGAAPLSVDEAIVLGLEEGRAKGPQRFRAWASWLDVPGVTEASVTVEEKDQKSA